MNTEQMRIEFEDWWEQFKSEHEEWMWADREALLFQAWQAALQAKSVPDGWKPSEQEILDYASAEELFLFADEYDYLAIANGVLELVQIRINKTAPQQADKVRELEAKYNELIMAVASKYPNETRHQTALRYINDAEFRAEQDNKGE